MTPCAWILDDSVPPYPQEPNRCPLPALPGSVYCEEHHRVAYVKPQVVKEVREQRTERN